jgi:Autophagy-related protein 13
LHVPLRLDVYYQHPDQRRELLERWCLEYAPVQQQQFEYSHHHPFSNDPIVQLRHVCKKIVIWLRTLYCWSRMLPSQALRGTTIGFSIYVVSEGNDDVTSLVSNQQFRVQGGGGGAAGVSTPYGQLGWKVFYAPPAAIERLIPRPTPYHATPSSNSNNGSVAPHAMPIAIPGQQQHYQPHQQQLQQQQQQQYQQHQFEPYTRRDSSPTPATVQSAPNQNRQMMYHRSHSAAEGIRMSPDATNVLLGVGGGGSGGKPTTLFAPRSHNGRGIVMAASTNGRGGQHQQVYHQLQPAPQQQLSFLPGTPTPGTPGSSNNNNGPAPSKTLSGLSLAMMMSDDNVDATDAAGNDDNNNNAADGGGTINSQQAEKRRAALHHAPPQLFLQQTTNGIPNSPLVVRKSSAGDYGYAYNSHIPSLRPMEQHQQQQPQQQYNNYNNSGTSFNYSSGAVIDRTASASPSMGGGGGGPLGSTPPGYLDATPPHKAGYLTGATPPTMMFMNQNRDSLIPPRSAVTPPFVRPLGFMVDNNNPPSPSMTMGAAVDSTATPHTVVSSATTLQMQTTPSSKLYPTTSSTNHTPSHHPVTSLDLLHSSPFQHPPNGSLLSSLSVHDPSYMNSVLSGDFRLQAAAEAAVYGAGGAGDDPFHHASLFGYHHHRHSSSFLDDHQHHNSTIGGGGAEEMPFAVEDASPPQFSSASGFAGGSASATSHLASSAAVASFAQRCSTASRLALFDSVAQQQQQQSSQQFHGSSATSPHDGMSLYHDMAVSSITDQLAEFKMFGASLMMNTNTTTGGVGPTMLGVTENNGSVGEPSAASNSTPISLRT